jgi:hypothetical protein
VTHHKFPSWRYGPKGESAVFESENDVPDGWHDHPSKHEKGAKAEPKQTKSAPKKAGRKPKAKPPALDL